MSVAHIIARLRGERRPSRRIRQAVHATLTELGLESEYLVEDFAREAGHELRNHTEIHDRHQKRVSELLVANNVEVTRRRAAEQAMRGMLTYAEQYAPEAHAALKAIADLNQLKG